MGKQIYFEPLNDDENAVGNTLRRFDGAAGVQELNSLLQLAFDECDARPVYLAFELRHECRCLCHDRNTGSPNAAGSVA